MLALSTALTATLRRPAPSSLAGPSAESLANNSIKWAETIPCERSCSNCEPTNSERHWQQVKNINFHLAIACGARCERLRLVAAGRLLITVKCRLAINHRAAHSELQRGLQ